MNTFQKAVALLLISMSVAFTSCSKSEDSTTPTPTPPTPPTSSGGNTNSLANQTWSLDQEVYAADEGNDLDWKRDQYGIYSLTANKVIGVAPNATTHSTIIRMGTVNMATGTYSLSTVGSSATFPANKIYATAELSNSSGTISYPYQNGGNATVINSATSFNIKINDAQHRDKKYNANFTVIKPTIPAANAAFTAPTGITPNSITVNGGAAIPLTLLSWDLGKLTSSSPVRGLTFSFARSLPLSGTYDIVPFNPVYNAPKPAPGKISIRYGDFTDPNFNNKYYSSVAGGTATVVNTNGVISVTINGVVLVEQSNSSQTATLSGNMTY